MSGPERAIALAAGLCAACAAPAPRGPVYRDPAGRFSLGVPAGWRQRPEAGGATFSGPPAGPSAYSAALSVSMWHGEPETYRERLAGPGKTVTPLVEESVDGRLAFFFWVTGTAGPPSPRAPRLQTKVVLVALSDGFLVIAAAAEPAGALAADDALGEALSSLEIH